MAVLKIIDPIEHNIMIQKYEKYVVDSFFFHVQKDYWGNGFVLQLISEDDHSLQYQTSFKPGSCYYAIFNLKYA